MDDVRKFQKLVAKVGQLIRTEVEKICLGKGLVYDDISPEEKLDFISIAITNLEENGTLVAGNLPESTEE